MRRAFRWLRITLWLSLLTLLCAWLWFNRIGLPDFLKQRALAELRAHGILVDFARLRWRWHGLVADQARFAAPNHGQGFGLFADELILRLDRDPLLQGR